jgi:hypothetical protein
MINKQNLNIRMIIHVAKRLGVLRDKVVFVGGCATGLFITDPAMPEKSGPRKMWMSLSRLPHDWNTTSLRKNFKAGVSNRI